MAEQYERDDPRHKAKHHVVTRSVNGKHEWKVLREYPSGKMVVAAKGEAGSAAEAKFLAEHRKQIVREGDAIH